MASVSDFTDGLAAELQAVIDVGLTYEVPHEALDHVRQTVATSVALSVVFAILVTTVLGVHVGIDLTQA